MGRRLKSGPSAHVELTEDFFVRDVSSTLHPVLENYQFSHGRWETTITWVGGLPWGSSGSDSVLPVQGAWVQPLVRELDPTWPN